jgi:membrane peptidoglycan carboxypeptidase
MALKPAAPKRVLAPEVAATVRRALMGVVREGTGTRARGVFFGPDKTALAIGGKTGTGDNRYESFAAGGKLIESRVVDRTATFVFFLGDRFFGTITAFVPGAEAANYHFTSGLAVQLLKSLAPQVQPLIDKPLDGPETLSVDAIAATAESSAKSAPPAPQPSAASGFPMRASQPGLKR